MFQCNACGEDLYVKGDVLSKNGKKIPLESRTNQPHQCTRKERWSSPTFTCKDCGMALFVSDEVLSPNGKRIPLNVANEEPHKCMNRRNNIPCRSCGVLIYFDDTRRSKLAKKLIPLNHSDGNPHECSEYRTNKGPSSTFAIGN